MKAKLVCNKIYVFFEGTKKHKFTVRFIIFGKQAITTDEAKKLANRSMHVTKRELAEKYDVIYGKASKSKRKIAFTLCAKPEANTIFIIPKKHRREAKKVIEAFSS